MRRLSGTSTPHDQEARSTVLRSEMHDLRCRCTIPDVGCRMSVCLFFWGGGHSQSQSTCASHKPLCLWPCLSWLSSGLAGACWVGRWNAGYCDWPMTINHLTFNPFPTRLRNTAPRKLMSFKTTLLAMAQVSKSESEAGFETPTRPGPGAFESKVYVKQQAPCYLLSVICYLLFNFNLLLFVLIMPL